MTRTLILTADDLGLTAGVNRGIFEAVRARTVTSASLMIGAPGWSDALDRIRADETGLSVGLHLNLTVGRPLTAARTLTDRAGRFLSLAALTLRATTGGVDPDEVLVESAAQLHALTTAGVRPTHLDGHRHVHLLPAVAPAVLEAARSAGVGFVRMPFEPAREAWRRPAAALKQVALRASAAAALRGRTRTARAATPAAATAPVRLPQPPVHFRGIALLGARDMARRLVELFRRLPEGVTEIAVHPGYVTPELAALDPYTSGREREVEALTSPEVIAGLRDGALRVVGFGQL